MIESTVILIGVGLSTIWMAIGLRNGRIRSRLSGRTSTATGDRLIVFRVAAPFIGVAGAIVMATGVIAAVAPSTVATAARPSGVGVAVVVWFTGWLLGKRAARAARQSPTR
jgi:hypothetical protein